MKDKTDKANMETLGELLQAPSSPAERFISSAERDELIYLREQYRLMQLRQEKKTERIQLLVRPALKADLDKEAKARKVSRNELITQILETAMEQTKEANT